MSVEIRRDGDRVLVCPGGRAPVESFLAPSVEIRGGHVVVDLGIDGEQEGAREALVYAGAVLYSEDAVEPVSLLFGEAVADAARRLWSDDERVSPVVVEGAPTSDEAIRALMRIAQGLWIRRYWPASRSRGRRIPSTSTALVDLELGALMLDPYVRACLPEEGLELLLLSPRRELALRLAERVGTGDDVSPFLSERLTAILEADLGWYLGRVEDDEYATDDEIARIEAALDRLAEGGRIDELALHHVIEALLDYEDEELFAYAAGEEDDDVEIWAGTAPVVWSQNLHGLFDAAKNVNWLVSDSGEGREILVSVEALDPNMRAIDDVRARIYLTGVPFPLIVQLTKEQGDESFSASTPLPRGADVAFVDVVSVGDHGRPLQGAALEETARQQRSALRWAESRVERIRECLVDANDDVRVPGLIPPKPIADSAWWLAEMEALFPGSVLRRP